MNETPHIRAVHLCDCVCVLCASVYVCVCLTECVKLLWNGHIEQTALALTLSLAAAQHKWVKGAEEC